MSDSAVSSIRSIIEQVQNGEFASALEAIAAFRKDQLAPAHEPPGPEDSVNIVDPALSVKMYLSVARRDLEAGDAASALISLDRALTAAGLMPD